MIPDVGPELGSVIPRVSLPRDPRTCHHGAVFGKHLSLFGSATRMLMPAISDVQGRPGIFRRSRSSFWSVERDVHSAAPAVAGPCCMQIVRRLHGLAAL